MGGTKTSAIIEEQKHQQLGQTAMTNGRWDQRDMVPRRDQGAVLLKEEFSAAWHGPQRA